MTETPAEHPATAATGAAAAPEPGAGEGGARVGVVGVGASAGGLEALERLFTHMPADTGLAFVVVQHLSPDHKSLMVELLSKHTTMKVQRVEDDVVVEPDTVFLLPPKKSVAIQGDRLRLVDRPPGHAVPLPVDIFFSSLAEARGDQALAVVLSGTGSDGMRGVRDIKAAGGAVLVQDETSAKFDGMPRAAISTGLVDAILPPEAMPARLVELARPGRLRPLDPADGKVADAYPRILDLLRRQTGVDFTHYKPASVLRRVDRRMGVTAEPTLEGYARLLAESPREVGTLFKELLIGVTRFFRDPEAFEALRAKVIPAILESTRWDQQVRVWVAGCSTGEEAYTLGILFLEAMEAAGRRVPVKIFATDIDREALDVASAGAYPEAIAADLTPERLARWFVRRGDRYVVGRELRALVLFAAHNLVKDPPFTRVDYVSCRNLLIYVEPVLQRRVLALFHYALAQGRYLMIGPSESLGDLADQFQPLDPKWKLFQSVGAPRASLGDSLPFGGLERRRPAAAAAPAGPPAGAPEPSDEATRWLAQAYAPAALLVTPAGELVHVFGQAQRFLSVRTGRASLLVTDMLERGVASAVATAIHQAHQGQREVRYAGLRLGDDPGQPAFDLRVAPVASGQAGRPHLLLVFEEARREAPAPVPGESLEAATERRLADLQGELQYTKENLQATIEELETSNEELQATNEELLSSNEELQSTNEELQSVNEELHTVNQEYQSKIQELSDLNADLDNLLRGTQIGTLFLDEGLRIRRFTPAVAELISVIPRDVGRSLEHFSFGFDAPGFLDDVRATLADGLPRELEARTGAGHRYLVRVLPYVGGAGAPRGVVVTFVDMTETVREKDRLQVIIDSLPHQVAVLDGAGRIVLVNRAWRAFAMENGGTEEAAVGVGADYLGVCRRVTGPAQAQALETEAGLRAVLAGKAGAYALEYPCHGKGVERWFRMTASALAAPFHGLVVSHVDVTARHLAEQALELARRP